MQSETHIFFLGLRYCYYIMFFLADCFIVGFFQCYFSVHDYESAKDDYEKVLTFEPGNKAAKNHVLICNQKLKQFKEKEKHIYAGMFNKFAEQDARNVRNYCLKS